MAGWFAPLVDVGQHYIWPKYRQCPGERSCWGIASSFQVSTGKSTEQARPFQHRKHLVPIRIAWNLYDRYLIYVASGETNPNSTPLT